MYIFLSFLFMQLTILILFDEIYFFFLNLLLFSEVWPGNDVSDAMPSRNGYFPEKKGIVFN